jgi:hypothetical protein
VGNGSNLKSVEEAAEEGDPKFYFFKKKFTASGEFDN